jgi:hypothetical protein
MSSRLVEIFEDSALVEKIKLNDSQKLCGKLTGETNG